MNNPVIKVEGLGKRYFLAHQGAPNSGGFRYKRFSDVLIQAAKSPVRWLTWKRENRSPDGADVREVSSGAQRSREEFWALKDLSFEIKPGEVVGVIGRNGSGKSTLLKLLSRITEPTLGRIEIEGRVASLLEVGTGFHPELTGRENIYLNGAILGMGKAEIKRKFDEIVAFAEVEKFLDTPVKRYSSGMYVRLAFAVAAHLEPDIFVVDEVLAVGDAQFQAKCLGKMQDIARNDGRTVLFVSHNMSAVRSLCHRGIVLESGQKQFEGTASEAIAFYSRHASAVAGAVWTCAPERKQLPVSFERIKVRLSGEQPRLKLICEITLSCQIPSARFFVAVDICDQSFSPLMQALPEAAPFIEGVPGKHQLDLEIELPPLIPGIYSADFWVGSHYTRTLDFLRSQLVFEVTKSPSPNRSFPHSSEHGWAVPITEFNYSLRTLEQPAAEIL